MKLKVLFLNEFGYNYKYPHHFDLFLSLVSQVKQEITGYCLCKGTDYEKLCIDKSGLIHVSADNLLLFIAKAIKYSLSSNLIICSTPLTLALSHLFPYKKKIYLPFELFETRKKFPYIERADLQRLLRFSNIPIFQTSELRASIFSNLYKTKSVVGTYSLGPSSYNVVAFKDKKILKGAIKIVQVGNLNDEGLADVIYKIAYHVKYDVEINLIGQINEASIKRIENISSANLTIKKWGKLNCDRYDLIKILSQFDFGLACKTADLKNLNDVTYTPNKLYDYLAAGIPVIVSDGFNGDRPKPEMIVSLSAFLDMKSFDLFYKRDFDSNQFIDEFVAKEIIGWIYEKKEIRNNTHS